MRMDGQKTRRSRKTSKISQYAVSLLFPPRCPVCDGMIDIAGGLIHEKCKKKLYPVNGPVCLKCGKMITSGTREYCTDCAKKKNVHFEQGKALFEYKGEIKQSIYRFKYNNSREYARYYASAACERYSKWMALNQIDAIIPVPMYRKKLRQRGYNQAGSFAKELSKITGIPVLKNAVSRVSDTPALKLLNYAQRKNALDGAFQVAENIVKYYQNILLVDDIYTTGSTVEEISGAIKKVCTANVYMLCICIGKQD